MGARKALGGPGGRIRSEPDANKKQNRHGHCRACGPRSACGFRGQSRCLKELEREEKRLRARVQRVPEATGPERTGRRRPHAGRAQRNSGLCERLLERRPVSWGKGWLAAGVRPP